MAFLSRSIIYDYFNVLPVNLDLYCPVVKAYVPLYSDQSNELILHVSSRSSILFARCQTDLD